MSKKEIPPTPAEFAKEKLRKIIEAIRAFFEVGKEEFDKSKRGFFRLTAASVAGVAVKSSGADRLLGVGHTVSEKEFKDVVTLLNSVNNGSDTFLIHLLNYFSKHDRADLRLEQQFTSLFQMDDKTLQDPDLMVLMRHFELPDERLDFGLIRSVFSNQKLIDQMGVKNELAEQIKMAMNNYEFSGSVNDFIKEKFAEPLFSKAEGFISRISQNGLERINPAEQEFLKQLPSYIDSHKFALSEALGLEKVVELENQVKSINFALNPEAFLNQATNEEMQDLFKNREYIATKDAIFSKKYACVKMFAYKALSEGRQIILSAVGAQDKVFVLSEKTEFGKIFNRLKEFSPAAVVKATRTSSAGELSIKR